MPLTVFEQLVVGPLQCNCYLVGDPETRDAIVIDPGDDADGILAAAEAHGLRLAAAVATHAHFDHVLAAEALRQRAGIPFYLHREDLPVLAWLRESGLMVLGQKLPPPPEVDRTLVEGDEISAGSVRLGVVHTPGHSPGSISLLADGEALFSGDTLFYASIGRTDLPGGDQSAELSSIRTRLFPLGDLPVYPGHGPATSLDVERVSNPFVGQGARLWTP
ncbi:MAG TPA: MBL fold metallo-hydrolase [Actinomycetota bacterium]|nr:MBL fold metallo-hydrolase [Actinomycetota bacterium]